MAERSQMSKLTVKDLGNPRKVTEENPTNILGTIVGVATGIKIKVDAAGQAFEAITGMFEGTRADNGNVVESGLLYLPGGFHEAITEQLKQEGTTAVRFAYSVASVHAKNPIGYSYAFKPLLKTARHSPLEALRIEAGLAEAADHDADTAGQPGPLPKEPAPAKPQPNPAPSPGQQKGNPSKAA